MPIPPLNVAVDPMVGPIVRTFVAEPLDVDAVVPPPKRAAGLLHVDGS